MSNSEENHKLELKRYELELRNHKILFDEFNAANNSARAYASQGMRSLLMLNGGAALAFLALIGHMYSSNNPDFQDLPKTLVPSLLCFGWGALASVVTSLLSYFTELMLAGAVGEEKTGFYGYAKMGFHILAVLACLSAVALFILGLVSIADVFDKTTCSLPS